MLPDDEQSAETDLTYNEVRFACRCGRFLADSSIRHTDHRDDSRYYGVRTTVEWDCGRCGTVEGEEWEPQIVATATRVSTTAQTVEGVGTGAGEGATGQDTGTAWVTRSADCPEAPAQAHLLDPSTPTGQTGGEA